MSYFEHFVYWDKVIFEWVTIHLNQTPVLNAAEYLVHLKNYHWLILFFLAYGLYRNFQKTIQFLLLAFLLLAISESLSQLIKHAFDRPRPGEQMGLYHSGSSPSFPSAHALNTMAFATFIWLFSQKKIKIVFLLSLIGGICRVIANYHFPVDVMTGFAFGFFIAILYWYVYRFFSFCLNVERKKQFRYQTIK